MQSTQFVRLAFAGPLPGRRKLHADLTPPKTLDTLDQDWGRARGVYFFRPATMKCKYCVDLLRSCAKTAELSKSMSTLSHDSRVSVDKHAFLMALIAQTPVSEAHEAEVEGKERRWAQRCRNAERSPTCSPDRFVLLLRRLSRTTSMPQAQEGGFCKV